MTWGRSEIDIDRCQAADVPFARVLMRQVNNELAPDSHIAQFEAYIEEALRREYADLLEYFAADKGNGFWIVHVGETPAGTFGLERVSPCTVELRRMYLAALFRRRGLGSLMLVHAEREAKAMGYRTIVAWTSELQQAAISFYGSRGFTLAGEQVEGDITAKTVGSGFVRYRFEKQLGWITDRTDRHKAKQPCAASAVPNAPKPPSFGSPRAALARYGVFSMERLEWERAPEDAAYDCTIRSRKYS